MNKLYWMSLIILDEPINFKKLYANFKNIRNSAYVNSACASSHITP